MRRYVFETDRWLCLLKRSLLERNARAKQIAEQVSFLHTLKFILLLDNKKAHTSVYSTVF
jgi:hypothetical protein